MVGQLMVAHVCDLVNIILHDGKPHTPGAQEPVTIQCIRVSREVRLLRERRIVLSCSLCGSGESFVG